VTSARIEPPSRVPNQITVDADTAYHARVALDQMLALP
jgi:quinolinate synthase